MKEYAFSIMMFLLGILFISFPMLSAFVLSMMAMSLALFSFMAVYQLKKVPVYVEVRSSDNWTWSKFPLD